MFVDKSTTTEVGMPRRGYGVEGKAVFIGDTCMSGFQDFGSCLTAVPAKHDMFLSVASLIFIFSSATKMLCKPLW